MTQTLLEVIADLELSLAAATSVGATIATLSSAVDGNGVAIPAGKYGFTIDGDNASKEFIVCDLSGTALTNIQSVSVQGVATSGFAQYHRQGAVVTITDWVIFKRILNNLNGTTGFNSATPINYDAEPSYANPLTIPTVQYVLDTASGGTVTFNRQIITGDAGENVSAGDWVYYNTTDGEWYLTDADDVAKCVNVRIGKAIGAGTNGNPIAGGIFVSGNETVGTYVAGTTYYLSNTAGALSTSAGTNSVIVGIGDANGQLILREATPSQMHFLYGITGMIIPYASATPPAGFLNCDGSAVSRTTYAGLFAVTGTNYGVGDGATTFNLPNLLGRFPLGYSLSAPTKVLTFASRSGNVIAVTGIDNQANSELQTGQLVRYVSTGTVITGLTTATDYYVIRISATTFSLATSLSDANAGTAIALSSDGSGTQTFTLTYTARPLGQGGGEEIHTLTDAQAPSHSHQNYTGNGAGSSYEGVSMDQGTSQGSAFGNTSSFGSDTPHNIMPLFTVVNYIIKT